METFNGHARFLKEAHAYPLTNFPGHMQENLLGQLLRKKLEPRVEDWIEEHTIKGEREGVAQVNGAAAGLGKDELKELWSWATMESSGVVGPMRDDDGAFWDDFTIAEREAGTENVATGLRRKLDGESDDEDEDDVNGDKMEDVTPSSKTPTQDEAGVDTSLPPLPLDDVLRFMSTGAYPKTRAPNR